MENKVRFTIENLRVYPQDGKHQYVSWDFPFDLSKGEDFYSYRTKDGKEHSYNLMKNPENTTKKWIVHLQGNEKYCLIMQSVFDIKTGTLDNLISYCLKVYKEYLILKIEDLQRDLNEVKQLI